MKNTTQKDLPLNRAAQEAPQLSKFNLSLEAKEKLSKRLASSTDRGRLIFFHFIYLFIYVCMYNKV